MAKSNRTRIYILTLPFLPSLVLSHSRNHSLWPTLTAKASLSAEAPTYCMTCLLMVAACRPFTAETTCPHTSWWLHPHSSQWWQSAVQHKHSHSRQWLWLACQVQHPHAHQWLLPAGQQQHPQPCWWQLPACCCSLLQWLLPAYKLHNSHACQLSIAAASSPDTVPTVSLWFCGSCWWSASWSASLPAGQQQHSLLADGNNCPAC